MTTTKRRRKPMDPIKTLEQVARTLDAVQSWTASATQMRRAIDKASKALDKFFTSITERDDDRT